MLCCDFRAIKFPMAPHPTFKVGFGVSFLIIIFIVILHTPFYIASKISVNGVCYVDLREISEVTKKLDDLSKDEETGMNTGIWNHLLIVTPISIIGYILPIILVGTFYRQATKALSAELQSFVERIQEGKPAQTKEDCGKQRAEKSVERKEKMKAKGGKNRKTVEKQRSEKSVERKEKVKAKGGKNSKTVEFGFAIRRQKENKSVAQLMLCITIVTCMIQMPCFVLDLVTMLFSKYWLEHPMAFVKAFTLLSYLYVLHSAVSPLFYAGMHKEVRKLSKRIICKK